MSLSSESTDPSGSSSDSSPNLSPRGPLDTKAVEEEVRSLSNLKLMKCNDQIVALQTVIRDQYVPRMVLFHARGGRVLTISTFFSARWKRKRFPPPHPGLRLGATSCSTPTDWLALISLITKEYCCRVRCRSHPLYQQIRLVVEEGLNCMPAYPYTVTTPTGGFRVLCIGKQGCGVVSLRRAAVRRAEIRPDELCREHRSQR